MRFGTIYKLNEMKKKIIDFLTHNFTIVVVTAFVVATLDLWTLPGKHNIALGWIGAFLLFFVGIGYTIYKGFKS